MAKIYRYENDRGRGPYSQEGYEGIHGTPKTDPERHPSPGKDMGLRPGVLDDAEADHAPYRFAFPSPAHAHEWYNSEEQKKLSDKGYKLVEKEVPADKLRTSKSGKQVAYREGEPPPKGQRWADRRKVLFKGQK